MEPLPPAYLAALVPDDWKIAFHDDRMESIPYDEQTDIVAISIETYTAKRCYQIATEYRKRGVPVVMGGFHATLAPQEVTQYADAIVIGEAEETFPKLLADFKAGRMQIKYVAPKNKKLGFLRPKRSIYIGKNYLDLGLIEASRGCKFQCEFCAITSYFEATHRHRPIDVLLAEIEEMKPHKKLFFFVDDNIVSSPDFAKAFYKELAPLKIRWISQASITLTYDDELMGLMKDSGCQGILIGFESLNEKNLASMNKRFNAARGGFEAALKKLKEFQLRLYATFVFGYDHDTIDSFQETIDFCIKHKIFMTAFNHLTPFPGTPLYTQLEQEGRLLYDQWWLDDRYRYGQVPFKSTIPPEIIQEKCVDARKEFYALGSTFYRMFDKTNSGNLQMLKAFWFINLLLRKEARQRENYPLGDESFQGEILKAAHLDSRVLIK
ncbi:MAG: B12-binding domain-containing radical SAM protein [Lentisphaeria bacterium]|nr:B12-binding domain-containing radical SAM protein [Lentisphaeria bacterium]